MACLLFWALGLVLYRATGYIQPLILFGLIGTVLGGCVGLYSWLPRPQKPLGRKLSLVLIGGGLFVGAALLGKENMQLEGFFIGLLSGVFQAAVMHYLIAKIALPVLLGRVWCSWGCWTAAVLDLLPYSRSGGRLAQRWGLLRYAHFALSLGLVLLLWYGLRLPLAAAGPAAVQWFLVGNALYYVSAVALAVRLRDNRAFCKYLCPITVPLKLGATVSLLRVAGDPLQCTGCGACSRACPMDIDVESYIQRGSRVRSTECTVCQTCISACPTGALYLSMAWDAGASEALRQRPATRSVKDAGARGTTAP